LDKGGISRRKFTIGIAAVLAALLIGLWIKVADLLYDLLWNREVIDPPPGVLFMDPVEMPNLSSGAGVVEVNIEAKMAPININGTTTELMTYNGYFPQPTIRVKRGEILNVNFKNSLPEEMEESVLEDAERNVTNLHTHGWHVSPSGNSDNVLISFSPGDEFLYEYDTSKQEGGTLSYLHPLVNKTISDQMWSGLSGCALVVEDETNLLSSFETHIISLKDISLTGSKVEPYTLKDYITGKEGNIVMVNGQVNPVLPIKPGQVQRWRIVNASTARFYKLSLDDHTMYLVGTDGGLLDKPYPLSEILLAPGERVDVLIKADRSSGDYKLRSLPYNRGSNILQRITLMTISYKGTSVSDNIPPSINPNAKRLNMDISSLPRKRLEFRMGKGVGLINGKEFGKDTLTISSEVGTYEVWEIVNRFVWDHPFHLHVNAYQILSIEGGDQNYASLYTSIPAWKDTTIVPRGGRMTILVPVLDYTGSTAFYCNILEHADIGMMGIWKIGYKHPTEKQFK
jgi:FtsP/CotA-like multicopper oxidase with cupredoxin domain